MLQMMVVVLVVKFLLNDETGDYESKDENFSAVFIYTETALDV